MDAIKYMFEFVSEFKEIIFIVILLLFLGFEVVSKVSSEMLPSFWAGANAMHGIIVVGAIIVLGYSENIGAQVLGTIAVLLSSFNFVVGFFVTKRSIDDLNKETEQE